MAVPDDACARLTSQPATPIALLNPTLDNQSSRVVHGEVTLTWPYNSIKNTVAFLLAEPDVRLRRVKGQVRIELRGAAAKAVAECGLGGGDNVILSLDGAEWAADESPGRIPGARLDWQLKFTGKLALQVKLGETGEIKHIDVDHGQAETPPPALPPPTIVELQNAALEELPRPPATARKAPSMDLGEYPSPAFMKRARISYGALFEGGLDIFEEDGGVKGKGRKRSRFGRDSNAWRYSSQSPSPEPTSPPDERMSEGSVEEAPSRPRMRDNGAQVVESQIVAAVSQRVDTSEPAKWPNQLSIVEEEARDVRADPAGASDSQQEPSLSLRSPTIPQEPGNTLFGVSKPTSATFSMFGTTNPVHPESGFSLADQVRFGFSRNPRSSDAPGPMDTEPVYESIYPHGEGSSAYPETYLDSTAHSNDVHTSPYLDSAHGTTLHAVHGLSSSAVPSSAEEYGQGRWEFSQPPHDYDRMEDGQPVGGTLNEGDSVALGEAASFDEFSPPKIPDGFSSYGTHMDPVVTQSEIDEARAGGRLQQDAPDEEKMAGNEETPNVSEDDMTADSEGEEDIEEGDYDQRIYDIPDDDEGVSGDNDLEPEGEVAGEEYLYDEDEDGYGEHWEEEEESEGEHDSGAYIPQTSPKRASAPVVISLLSDSEDDDEPPAPPITEANLVGGRRPAPSRTLAEPPPAHTASSKNPPSQPSIVDLANAVNHHSRLEALSVVKKVSEDETEGSENVTPLAHDLVQVVDFASGSEGLEHPPESHFHGAAITAADEAGAEAHERSTPDYVLHSGREEIVFRENDGSYAQDEDEEMGYDDEENSTNVSASDDDMQGPYATEEEIEATEGIEEIEEVEEIVEVEVEVEEEIDEVEEIEELEEIEDPEVEAIEEIDEPEENTEPKESKSIEIDKSEELGAIDELEAAESVETTQDSDVHAVSQSSRNSSQKFGDQQQLTKTERPVENEEEGDVLETELASTTADAVLAGDFDVEMAETTQLGTESETQEPAVMSEAIAPAGLSGDDGTQLAPAVGPDSASDSMDRAMDEDDLEDAAQQPNGHVSSHMSPPATQSFGPQGHYDSQMPGSASPTACSPVSKDGVGNYQLLTPMESQITAEMVSEAQFLDEDAEAQPTEPSQPAESSDRHSAVMPELLSPVHVAHSSVGLGIDQSPAELVPAAIAVSLAEAQPLGTLIEEAAKDVPAKSTEKLGNEGAASLPEESPEHDLTHAEEDTATASASVSVIDLDDKDAQASPQSVRRSTRNRQRSTPIHSSPGSSKKAVEDQITVQGYHTRSHDANAAHFSSEPPSPDLSVRLAKQAVAGKRSKKAPEPLRASPRMTRARSSSLQMSAASEPDSEEDASISLARAALASPSKLNVDHSSSSTSSLKAELTKRLRSHRECISLKTLRNRLDEHPDVLAVITTQPPPAVRAKGGPREYVMTFNVTDPSTAPTQVIEVQLYRPHKDSLPVVTPGDAILLRKFQVKSFSKKGFGLRSHDNSSWAVFDQDEGAPQIKGPPIEDWKQYSEYMGLLRAWYQSMDGVAKEKIEKANKKLEDASQGK